MNPGSKASNARLRVDNLHRIDGEGALRRVEVALDERAIEKATLWLVWENRSGNAGTALTLAPVEPRAYSSQEASRVSAPRRYKSCRSAGPTKASRVDTVSVGRDAPTKRHLRRLVPYNLPDDGAKGSHPTLLQEMRARTGA
jgi:hypothetical protein